MNGSLKKSQLIYNLDSDDTPKEDQDHKYKPTSNTNDIDEDMMKEIEMEIMRETNIEDYSPVQRKIVKPVGPKRKINPTNDDEETEIESQIAPKLSMTRSQRAVRTSTVPTTRNWEEPEEESKIITAEEEEKPKRKILGSKRTSA
jgi:hypothetical protein